MKVKVSRRSPLAGKKLRHRVAGKQQKAFPLSSHSTSIFCIMKISVRYLSFPPYLSFFFAFHVPVALTLLHVLKLFALCVSLMHTQRNVWLLFLPQMSCWPLSPELRKRTAYHNGARRSKMLMEGRPCTDPPVSIDAPSSAVTLQTRALTKMCPLPLSCFAFFPPCTHFQGLW